MLTVLRHILYLALVFVLQTTWVHHLAIGGVQPDLVLLTVVFIALLAGQVEAGGVGRVAEADVAHADPSGVARGLASPT